LAIIKSQIILSSSATTIISPTISVAGSINNMVLVMYPSDSKLFLIRVPAVNQILTAALT